MFEDSFNKLEELVWANDWFYSQLGIVILFLLGN